MQPYSVKKGPASAGFFIACSLLKAFFNCRTPGRCEPRILGLAIVERVSRRSSVEDRVLSRFES